MPTVAPISRQIWDMKYRAKTADGTPLDATIEDSWRRVAAAAAAAEPEADRGRWTDAFASILSDFHFLPAGRILAGAGTERRVTLFNCFVMGTIPDDMSGIFEHLKEAALTMQAGGGIGYDFSTLRPKGAPVKGVGADASGPLTFMDVWDAMCRTIMSAGYRRGAMMGTLRCDHPDVEAFIEAKQDPGRLRMFNLSVLVTDAFMEAVKRDDSWDLVFDGVVYKAVGARELWDRIMRATYAYAEPGVIFIDRINQRNNLYYCETIHATNPCVTADTWVQTDEGARQVAELVGRPFRARVDGRDHASGSEGFFATGRKPVLRIATVEGHELYLTADHPVRAVTAKTRYRLDWTWRPAGKLTAGEEIVLNNHRDAPSWPGVGTDGEGYLLGLLVGDGTLKQDKAVLSVWPGRMTADGTFARAGVEGVMQEALDAAKRLPHRSDFQGWIAVSGRDEWRLASGAVKRLAREYGLAPGRKAVTPAIERGSSAFHQGFLRGLFDADGTVTGSQRKGISVRLAQSDLQCLRTVQRMLLRLGIVARIYRNRRPAGVRQLPDGKAGHRAYLCRADHELVIANDNAGLFAERIGFCDGDKATRLRSLLAAYHRTPNRERFLARVENIEGAGEADVFDVRVPGVNAFDANGVVVHNCGEQPLPPYGACLLASVNLARLVTDSFEDTAAIDPAELERVVALGVRFMDNVIDISRFPLETQRQEAEAKRRIGLGVTGLADALIFCKARYGSARAIELTRRWMHAIQRAAYLASAELAAEKGAFPLFDRDAFLAGENVAELDEEVRRAIAEKGLRNALLTTVAPTGTISILADNVSSGVEPVFSFTYKRYVLMPDGSRREEQVSDYAYRRFRARFGDAAELPDYFVDAQSLSPADHVDMQAAAQAYVDSSISKTINCSEDIDFEAFKDVYLRAYDLGCKGCTTYRPNAVTGAVLETDKAASARQAELPLEVPAPKPRDVYEAGGVVYMTRPLDRPEALPGRTYKINWPESDHAIYITLNDIVQDGRIRPFEVFINSKNMEHYAWTVALTRMISAVFRRGGDVSFVVEELKAVFDPRGGHWMGGHYVPSLLAAIGEVIETHMREIGFIPAKQSHGGEPARAVAGALPPPEPERRLKACSRCGLPSLIRQENCDVCTSCGYSKCS